MKKHRICSALFVSVLFLFTACSGVQSPANAPAPADESGGRNGVRETKTVITDLIEADTVDLSDSFDRIRGMVQTGAGTVVISGIRDDVPHVLITDQEINTIHSFSPLPAKEDTGEIIGVCANIDGGFSIYYQTFLEIYDDEGKLTDSIDLGTQQELRYGPVHLGNDRYLFWWEDSIYVCNKSGVWKEQTIARESYIYTVCRFREMFLICLIEDGRLSFRTLEPDTLFTESFTDFTEPINSDCLMYSGNGDTFFVNNGTSVYSFIPQDNRFEKRFDWAQTKAYGRSIEYLVNIDNETTICFERNRNTVFCIKKTGETSRKLITVGSVQFAPSLLPYVNEFNANNSEYYAEIRYYDYYNQDTMLIDLGTGRAPDVLNLNMADYIPRSENNFVDLLPFLDADDSIDRSDFYKTVFDRMLVDGKMITAQSSFTWYSLSARASDVGHCDSWTFRDAMDLFEREKDRFILVGWNSPSNMTSWMCRICIPQFVDYESMTCDFENEEFLSLLEFCKAMSGRNAPEDIWDYDERILLSLELWENEFGLSRLKKGYGGADYSLMGFPNNDGRNASFFAEGTYDLSFAIPYQTEDKEGAWEFIKGIYADEWQDEGVHGFPMIQRVLDLRWSRLLEEPESFVTQVDIDRVKTLMDQTDRYGHEDETIIRIVIEEAMYCIEGDKTAEEVASIIQSRVSLLLSERK